MSLTQYKTIFEYHLPPPIAERALRNATDHFVGWRMFETPATKSIGRNIMDGFNWSTTPERTDFWCAVYDAANGYCPFPSVKSLR